MITMSTGNAAPAAELTRLIISTRDLERAMAIYSGVLGFDGAATGEVAMLRNGAGAAIMLHQRPTVPSDTAVAAAFTVDDLDVVVGSWQAAGGSVIDAPADQPWGERMAVVRDADDHIVCLINR